MLHWIDLLTGYIGPARRTVAVLIAANLLPLLLVASGLWSLQQVMLLYWLENGVIGLWSVAKILRSGFPPMFSFRLFMAAFFCVHFGGFFVIHGFFLIIFLQLCTGSDVSFLFNTLIDGGLLRAMLTAVPDGLWPMVFVLVCSHGYSAIRYHFSHGLWRSANSVLLMKQPYGRVVLLHLTLLGFGFLVHWQGESIMMLVLMVLMKITLDVVLHVRSHRQAVKETAAGDPGRVSGS